jgi:hypothetical protein
VHDVREDTGPELTDGPNCSSGRGEPRGNLPSAIIHEKTRKEVCKGVARCRNIITSEPDDEEASERSRRFGVEKEEGKGSGDGIHRERSRPVSVHYEKLGDGDGWHPGEHCGETKTVEPVSPS